MSPSQQRGRRERGRPEHSRPEHSLQERALRCSIAGVWLATGVLVLHPGYRQVGGQWLDLWGLPHWLMFITCAAEVGLAAWLISRPMSRRTAGLQLLLMTGFTLILAAMDPMLLASPYGVLTKNLPMAAVIGAATLLAEEGWTTRTVGLLRAGMALIWISEGLIPKVLFQQASELAMVPAAGISIEPSLFLGALGLAQVASGVGALVLRGRVLCLLLTGQAVALLILPLIVSWQDPSLWVHPFGPMTKNLPIFIGTVVLAHRCWRSP